MDSNQSNFDHNTQQRSTSHNGSDLNDDFKKVKESVTQTAQHAKEKATDLIKETIDRSADIQENIITYVKENPVKALSFAILGGFLAAILVRK